VKRYPAAPRHELPLMFAHALTLRCG
jgi:hypothetical protein